MRTGFRSKCVAKGALCGLAFTARAHVQQFVTELNTPDTTSWRGLGTSIAMDATTLVTGAPESLRKTALNDVR